MKKILIISIIAFVFVSSSLKAQDKPFVFGFKAAPNMGWMNPGTEDYDNDGMRVGFSWGLIAEFHLMENYDLNSGINVLFLNGTLSYMDNIAAYGGEGELFRKYNFKYLEIPLTLKMKTNEYANKSFYGMFGFGANFLLAGKAKDTFIPNGGVEMTDEQDIKDELKGIRASLIIGVGMEFKMNATTTMIMGVNFNNGITDVLKSQNILTNDINKSINNYLEFYLGILF